MESGKDDRRGLEAKLKAAEGTVAFIQEGHSKVLSGLHREIQDLLRTQLRPAPLLSPLRDPYPDLDVEELLQGPLRPVPLLSPLRDPCPDPELEDALRRCRLSPPLSPL